MENQYFAPKIEKTPSRRVRSWTFPSTPPEGVGWGPPTRSPTPGSPTFKKKKNVCLHCVLESQSERQRMTADGQTMKRDTLMRCDGLDIAGPAPHAAAGLRSVRHRNAQDGPPASTARRRATATRTQTRRRESAASPSRFAGVVASRQARTSESEGRGGGSSHRWLGRLTGLPQAAGLLK